MTTGAADRSDPRRLRDIRRAVDEGAYHVDALAVADAFLREWPIGDVVGALEGTQSNDGSGTSSSSD